jgi:cytochrome c553
MTPDAATGGDRGASEQAGGNADTSHIPPERASLCARPADDVVRDLFCKGDPTTVSNLRELLARLEIDALPVDMDEASAAQISAEPDQLSENVVLLGHSTALSGQLVSPINPRAILLGKQALVAFQRGVQKAEIAALDRVSKQRNFYLVSFKQACNERAAGCVPGDLYTPSLERDWREVKLEDDEDLKNTPLDCRQCHQRKLEKPVLLMRELLGPWTHFFFFAVAEERDKELGGVRGGVDLVRAFLRAKGSESYAGMPSAQLRQTSGVTLQRLVTTAQPLQFDPSIPPQLESSASNGRARRSPVWDRDYAAFKRGEQLALPYYESDATDPAKRDRLGDAYARYRRGELSAEALPELSDIFPDDPQVRAEIGLQIEPSATPAEALLQACGACHNDVLDQQISRARFNIALSRMSRDELDLAIARIALGPDDAGVMPPKGMRQLDAAGKQRLLEYLRANVRSADDDALLESAAKHGMTKDGYGYLGL